MFMCPYHKKWPDSKLLYRASTHSVRSVQSSDSAKRLVYFYNNRGDKETRSRLECCPIADRQTSVDSLHAVHFSACKGMAVRTTDAPRLMENQLIPFPCFFLFYSARARNRKLIGLIIKVKYIRGCPS